MQTRLITATLVLLWLLEVHARAQITTVTRDAVNFERSKARATVIAYVCYLYEADNGRFPLSEANLHWPLDYVGPFEHDYGVRFESFLADPLSPSGQTPFMIRPVLGRRERTRAKGAELSSGDVHFVVLSPSRDGGMLRNFAILYDDALTSGSQYSDPNASILYMTDDGIGSVVTSKGFSLRRVIDAADVGTTEPNAGTSTSFPN
jgi:hypothetical protein